MVKKNLDIALSVAIYFVLTTSINATSISKCWGTWAIETLLPGVGYSRLGQYDKALTFGITRWLSLERTIYFRNHKDFEPDDEKIYRDTSDEHGGPYRHEDQVDVFMPYENFMAANYWRIYFAFWQITSQDLYDKTCEYNNETYGYFLSPLKFWDYLLEPTFYPGVALQTETQETPKFVYHTDGYTKEDLQNWTLVNAYLTSIGEELLSRGIIQNWFYHLFKDSLSHSMARWSSNFVSSVIFTLLHGEFDLILFVDSMYTGWVYHGANPNFDLDLAIAIHFGANTITDGRRLQRAKDMKAKPGEDASNFDDPESSRTLAPRFTFQLRF